MDFFVFTACAIAIGMVGPRMVDAVEAIADHTGIGRVWLGGVLLAGATSMPELVSTISAGAIDEPDLAVGAVFGSNMFNMAILGGFLALRPRVFQGSGVHPSLAILPIVLAVLALLAVAIEDPSLGRIGLASLVLTAGYLIGSYTLYRWEPRGEPNARSQRPPPALSLSRTVTVLAAGTAVILVAAIFIAEASRGVATTLGISGGVVGVVALAFATSLPELATSLTALHRRAPDLLIGNVFGSNVFNMAVVLPADIAFNDGGILSAVSSDQAAPATAGVVLMALAMLALFVHRSWHRLRVVGWLMVAAYVTGAGLSVVLGVDVN